MPNIECRIKYLNVQKRSDTAHENYFLLIEKVIIVKKLCAARFGYQLLIEQEF